MVSRLAITPPVHRKYDKPLLDAGQVALRAGNFLTLFHGFAAFVPPGFLLWSGSWTKWKSLVWNCRGKGLKGVHLGRTLKASAKEGSHYTLPGRLPASDDDERTKAARRRRMKGRRLTGADLPYRNEIIGPLPKTTP